MVFPRDLAQTASLTKALFPPARYVVTVKVSPPDRTLKPAERPFRVAQLELRHSASSTTALPSGQVSEALWPSAPVGDATVVTADACYVPLTDSPTRDAVEGKVVVLDAVFPDSFLPRVYEAQAYGAVGIILLVRPRSWL